QLYIAKSLDLRAAEGESPEIRSPEAEEMENYNVTFLTPYGPFPLTTTPVIMVNGSSDDIDVNITGFVIDGSSVTPEGSTYGICGIVYYNAGGLIEGNEIKNIWGVKAEEIEPPLQYNGYGVFALSESNITIHRNNIHNYTGVESAGIGILSSGASRAKVTITENTITGARSPEFPDQCGIYTFYATATVNDNIVSDHIYTEGWAYASGIGVSDTNLSAQGNTLIGGGIWVNTGWGSQYSTAFITNNVVDVSGVHEEECGPLAGVAVTTYPPIMGFYPYEGEPSVTATVGGNQLVGGSGSGIIIGGISELHAEWGFEPVGTVDATITRNTVSDWDCGIELLNCSNSTVYLNDFVDNTQNVFVNESTNVYSSPEEIDYTYDGRDYT
ncbi:MAG: hypothetical protein KAT65_04735, partial [Methanophagales archaeon]|nr:hypothetical protein [Methanophagales archaeon]